MAPVWALLKAAAPSERDKTAALAALSKPATFRNNRDTFKISSGAEHNSRYY